MPKYLIGGKVIQADKPLSDEDIDYIAAQIEQKNQKPAEEKGGFLSSLANVPGHTAVGAGQILKDIGAPEWGETLSKYGHQVLEENPLAVQSFEDIRQHPKEWLSESAGQMGGQALSALGGGALGRGIGAGIGALTAPFGLAPIAVPALSTLGGFIGSVGPMAAQEYGSQREEQARQGVDDPLRAAIGAAGNVAIENLGGFRPAGALKDLTKGVKELTGMSTGQALKYLAGKGIKSGLSEAAEEIPQQYVGSFGGGTNIQDLNTPENAQQAALGAAMALPGGALFGSGRVLANQYLGKDKEEGQAPPETEQPAPPGAGPTQPSGFSPDEQEEAIEEPFVRRPPSEEGRETFADTLGVRKPAKPVESSVYDKLNALDPENPYHVLEASKLLAKVAAPKTDAHKAARDAIHAAASEIRQIKGPSYAEHFGIPLNTNPARRLNKLYVNDPDHIAEASELLHKISKLDSTALKALEEKQNALKPDTSSDADTLGHVVPTEEGDTTGVETPERGGLDTSANTTEQPTAGEVGSDVTLETPEDESNDMLTKSVSLTSPEALVQKASASAHTKESLRGAVTKVMDKIFGEGWTQRLENTGKFKIINKNEAADIIGDESLKSVADIKKLGKDVTGLDNFADQFQTLIKQPDKTIEDVNRIAQSVVDNVKEAPQHVLPKVTGASFPYKRYLQMPDGNTYDPENINHVNASPETKLIYEAQQKGPEALHRVLQIEADGVNKQRSEDLGKLAKYLDGNGDYTKAEQAMILDGARKFGYSTKQKDSGVEVSLVNLTDSNTTPIAVIDGVGASLIAEQLRKGLNIKQAMKIGLQNFVDKQSASRETQRNGWEVFKQSNTEEDAVELNKACAGREWCTAGAVSTARQHRSGGDFWLYFDKGEAKIALRTTNGTLAEPPRGSLPAQRLTEEEAKIANDFLKSGKVDGGKDFVDDQEYMQGVIDGTVDPISLYIRGRDPERWAPNGYGYDANEFPDVFVKKVHNLYDNTDFEALGIYEELPSKEYYGKVTYVGRITNTKEDVNLPNATTVGDIAENEGDIALPNATTVGHIRGNKGYVSLPNATTVGDISFNSVGIRLPNATTVGGVLYNEGDITMPNATTVGGILYNEGDITLPNATTVGNINNNKGDITLPNATTVKAIQSNEGVVNLPSATTVGSIRFNGGDVHLPNATTVEDIVGNEGALSLPNVTTVRDIAENEGDITLPNVTTVEEIQDNTGNISLPKVTTVRLIDGNGGDISLPNATTVETIQFNTGNISLPKVTTVGDIESNEGDISLPNATTVEAIARNTGKLNLPKLVNVDSYAGNTGEIIAPIDLSGEKLLSKNKVPIAFFNPKDNTTYFIHDSISANSTDDEILGLVMHEIATHALKLGKSSAEFKTLLKQFEALKNSNPAIKKAFDSVPDDTNPQHVTQEGLAYFLQQNPKAPFTQRVIQLFKKFIRAIGNNLKGIEHTRFMQWANKLSEQDLREMAIKALRTAPETLGEKAGGEGETLKSFAGKSRLAPNGKPSNLNAMQYEQVRTPEFKAWFGDWENDPKNASKVVDENGEPLVVYHGTDADFTEFDSNALRTEGRRTSPDSGISLSYSPKFASNYAKTERGHVMPLFVKADYIWKPNARGIDDAKIAYEDRFNTPMPPDLYPYVEEGYWAAVEGYLKELSEYGGYDGFEVIERDTKNLIVLDHNQVKSAIGNTGAFSSDNNDIRFSKIPEVDALTGKPTQHTKAKTKPSLAKALMDLKSNMNWTKLEQLLLGFEAPVSKAVKDLDTFSRAGDLSAGYVLRGHVQQLVNLIKTSLEKGPVVLSGEGLGMIDPKADPSKSIFSIHSRIKEIGDKNNFDGPQVFAEVMRIKWGEETQQEDAAMRQKGAQHRADAALLKQQLTQAIAQGNITPQAIRSILGDIKKHTLKADKFENIRRDTTVTQDDIDKANDVLKAVPEFVTLMEDIRNNTRANVNLMYQAGNINKTTRDVWNSKKYYMPMQFYEEHPELFADVPKNWLGKSGARSVPGIKPRKGHTSAVNFWDNLVKQQAFIVGVALKNESRNAALTQLEKVGMAFRPQDQTSSNKKGDYVVSYHNGEKVWWKVASPELVDSFQTYNHAMPRVFEVLGKASNVLRTTALVQPQYWFKQLIIDPIHASFVSNVGVVTPLAAFGELVDIMFNKSKSTETLRKHGVVGPVALPSQNDLYSQLGYALKHKPMGVQKIGHLIVKMHEATDAATRSAIYKKALKQAAKKGLVGRNAENYAVHKARETMNFAVHGTSATMNMVRHLVPFFSSSINGLATSYRAATGANLNAKEAEESRSNFVKYAATMAIMSAIYAAMMYDDKDYKDLKDFDKDNNWLLPLPNKNGKHEFIKIPIPYEIGFMFKTLPELAMRRILGDATTKEVWDSIIAGLVKNSPPFGLAQGIRPAAEVIANYDAFTGRPIESTSEISKPVEMRGEATASELAIFASKHLGLKNINLSPVEIDHLIKGYLAEWGSMGTAIADAMLRAAEGKHVTPTKDWMHQRGNPLHGLATDATNTRSMSKLYKLENEAQELVNGINYYKRFGKPEEVQAILKDSDKAKLLRAHKMLKHHTDKLAEIRKVIARAASRPDTPANRAFIRERQKAADAIAERAVAITKQLGLE